MTATSKARRPSQHADESTMEYLRRVVSACNFENESLLDSFKSVDAVLDFFDLWHAYDTEFWSGVMECIAEGADPKPARAFVRKHGLSGSWKAAIDYAVANRNV